RSSDLLAGGAVMAASAPSAAKAMTLTIPSRVVDVPTETQIFRNPRALPFSSLVTRHPPMLNEFTMVVALEVGPRQFAALDGLELAIEQTEPFDQGASMGDGGLCRSRSDGHSRAPDDCKRLCGSKTCE